MNWNLGFEFSLTIRHVCVSVPLNLDMCRGRLISSTLEIAFFFLIHFFPEVFNYFFMCCFAKSNLSMGS